MQWMVEQALKDKNFVRLRDLWQVRNERRQGHINVVGPGDVHQAFILSALHALDRLDYDEPQGLVIIVPDVLQARLYREVLQSFLDEDVLEFPTREFQLSPVDASSKEQMQRRLQVLSRLLQGDKPILVVSAPALLQPLPSLDVLKQNSVHLALDVTFGPQELGVKLEQMGYERVPLTDAPGQFSLRGDIVDIFPIHKPKPEDIPLEEQLENYGVRVSFFDREIDQLRYFDPITQRQVSNCSSITIPPAREIILTTEEQAKLVEEIEKWGSVRARELYQVGANKARVEAFRAFLQADQEKISTGIDHGVVDRYIPLLEGKTANLLDVLQGFNYRPVVVETLDLNRRMDAWDQDQFKQMELLLERGKTTKLSFDVFYQSHEVMQRLDQKFSCLSFSLLLQAGNGFPGAERIDIQSRQAENYRGYEDKLYTTLKERQNTLQDTYIFVPDQARRERLHKELLLHAPGTVKRIVPENLASGFEWPKASLLILGTQDVFGVERRKRPRKKKQSGIPIAFFSDLTPGDLVVHEVHGIGQYEGLETLESDDSWSDYIKIRYQGEDVLYLPMSALDQIRKYVATGGRKAKLSKLGGGEWDRLKNRARESIKKLATDLVELYAKRRELKGFSFPEDTVWDQEFAEHFPYEETEDQLQAVREIKADMETDKVMDRLLCGDVGFGKTEVAFRAMFKAVNGGKQAALLAPTTVLAQQHYQNFKERIANFPVRIGHLSRFASPAMQKRTLKGLASGEIDVVIGTHRILSNDVKFRDLGLLVVDEEQRFGVDDKEKIKALYPKIDVLSLSATPIPRTLHMSMAGIRDISIIEEPPQDRREVQTFVMEYQEDIIADAILREISRGGQIFYLFNNVKKILQEQEKIEQMVPGARVLIAHGQMPERQLEDVIQAFLEGEADVLLCTTIIESGIDMPNVNTLIVTQANRMGLAQLYQLKGRVGRSRRQAYAYVTYNKDQIINEDAQKRLAAIREYTELGSGFRIALRDLEVRGAGNLLGAEQHGHMEAIGYELYVQMLEEEVEKIMPREEVEDFGQSPRYEIPESVDTNIQLALNAYLPQSLIPDEGQRMDMYRRLGEIRGLADYYDILDELSDRYGELPAEAYTLADVSYIKARAGKMGIAQIRVQKKNIVMEFQEGGKPNMVEVSKLFSIDEYKRSIRFSAGTKANLLWVNQGQPVGMVPERLRKLFAQIERVES